MAELTGRQRAAALLAQLEPDRAADVLAKLSEPEAMALGAEMARLPALGEEDVKDIADDLRRRLGTLGGRGGEDVALALLTARFGARRAAELIDELRARDNPRRFAFLSAVDPDRLALFLEGEHPQLIATVLAQLRRERAGQVLGALQPSTRTEVARRVAAIRGLSQEAMTRLNDELEARLLSIATARAESTGTDGMDAIVAILTSVEQRVEKQVVEQLAVTSPALADEIRSRLFTFQDLVSIDDRALQELLRRADDETLVLAMKGKPPELVERLAAQLTKRRGEQLFEDLAALGPQHARVVEDAEASLVRLALLLDEEEVIQLNRTSDPMLE